VPLVSFLWGFWVSLLSVLSSSFVTGGLLLSFLFSSHGGSVLLFSPLWSQRLVCLLFLFSPLVTYAGVPLFFSDL
jgi:hypothetical protein